MLSYRSFRERPRDQYACQLTPFDLSFAVNDYGRFFIVRRLVDDVWRSTTICGADTEPVPREIVRVTCMRLHIPTDEFGC
jgi:hypothetical protein